MVCKKCGKDPDPRDYSYFKVKNCMSIENGPFIPDMYKEYYHAPRCNKCNDIIDYTDIDLRDFTHWFNNEYEHGTSRKLLGKALMRYFCLDEIISEELFGNTQEIKNDLGEGIINCNYMNNDGSGSMGEIYILDKTKADHLLSLGFKYVTRQMDGKEVYVFIQTKELMNEIAAKFNSVSFAVSKTVKF